MTQLQFHFMTELLSFLFVSVFPDSQCQTTSHMITLFCGITWHDAQIRRDLTSSRRFQLDTEINSTVNILHVRENGRMMQNKEFNAATTRWLNIDFVEWLWWNRDCCENVKFFLVSDSLDLGMIEFCWVTVGFRYKTFCSVSDPDTNSLDCDRIKNRMVFVGLSRTCTAIFDCRFGSGANI